MAETPHYKKEPPLWSLARSLLGAVALVPSQDLPMGRGLEMTSRSSQSAAGSKFSHVRALWGIP